MTAAGPKRFIVRLRWERGAYTSPSMPQHDAEARVAELEKAVVDCGDGPRFVGFTGYDGRGVRVRGREVIGIECIPHLADRELPAESPGTHAASTSSAGAVVTGVQVHVEGAPESGTDFLRHLAGINGAMRR